MVIVCCHKARHSASREPWHIPLVEPSEPPRRLTVSSAMTYVTNNASTRCACSIEEMKFTPAHLVRNPQEKEDTQLTRYLFLLGFPFTGTSAVHFLLGTSANVSTLGNPKTLGPTKEGWHIAGTKEEYEDRWDPSGPRPKRGKSISWDAFPWSRIGEVYHSHWNLSRPLLVESSPPEIIHADRVNATMPRFRPKATSDSYFLSAAHVPKVM